MTREKYWHFWKLLMLEKYWYLLILEKCLLEKYRYYLSIIILRASIPFKYQDFTFSNTSPLSKLSILEKDYYIKSFDIWKVFFKSHDTWNVLILLIPYWKVLMVEKQLHYKSIDIWKVLTLEKYWFFRSTDFWNVLILEKYWYF